MSEPTYVYVVEDGGYDSVGPLGVFATLEGAMASREGAVWNHRPAGKWPNGEERDETWDTFIHNDCLYGGSVIRRWIVQP